MDHPAPQGGGDGDETVRPADARTGADISRLIMATSTDGVIAVDDQGIVRLCNPAAEELFGRPAKHLIGKQFGFPIVAGRTAQIELRLPDGRERVVEMRVAGTALEGERLHIASLRDITRRRQAERDLESAIQTWNLVVGVAAHEIHNPLAAISALAHTLQERQATMSATERASIVDRMVQRVVRLQLLVRKLLTASRIQAVGVRPNPQRVNVLEVIVEQLAEIEGQATEVRVTCDPDLEALVDRADLAMMLSNYLDNAFAYGAPPIEISAAARSGSTEIAVVDSGPGVGDEFVPRLFERYTRAPGVERAVEGTGLGLWIVRSFARANGGDAWYEPGDGGGSRFRLRLPLPPGSASGPPPR